MHLASGDDAICNIDGSGHAYVSNLETALWHPNGLLVKPFAHPETSLLEDGALRWIVDESAFFSRHYAFADVTLISDEEQECFSGGVRLAGQGVVRAVTNAATGEAWLATGAETDSARRRVRLPDSLMGAVLSSWGFDPGLDLPLLAPSDPFFSTYPAAPGSALLRDGTVVKEETASDLYLIADEIAMPVETWETYLLMGLFPRAVQIVPDGSVWELQKGQVGDCHVGRFCIDRAAVTTCGGTFHSGDADQGGEIESEGTFDTVDSSDEEPPPEEGLGDTIETVPGCLDADQDGFCSRADGGNDCYDRDSTTYPGAPEICGNQVDEDCDGFDLSCGPHATDTDGDGVMDADDNCILFDNSDQSDEDLDGIGDSCDPTFVPPIVLPPAPPEETDLPVNEPLPEPVDPAPPEEAADTTPPPPEPPVDTNLGVSPEETLSITWTTPFGLPASHITLSGEYIFQDGSYGFTWRSLQTVSNVNRIQEEIPWVLSGDTFRFSVEYVDGGGVTSWSCIGPFPPGRREGHAEATVAGTTVSIQETGDPSGLTTGCGLILTVP